MGLGQGASCAACGAEDTQRATFPGGPSLTGRSEFWPERRWHFCTQSQLRCCWETEPDDWTSGILSSRL